MFEDQAAGRAYQQRHVLGRSSSFWVCAAVVMHTLWTSAAPAMTYPLYAERWHLTTTVTTGIFAIYPITVVAVLIAFGDLSDYIGRRLALLLGLGASLIGVILFAVAADVSWLFAGRICMGIGVGLSAGPSAAGMVEFSAPGKIKSASSITAGAQSLGLCCALILGGALIEFAPIPMRLNFIVLAIVIAVMLAATWYLPAHISNELKGRWSPKRPSVPAPLRRVFAVALVAVVTGYSIGALMLSLGAHISKGVIGSNSVFINGLLMSIFAISSAIVSLLVKRMSSRMSIAAGSIAVVIGMAFMVLAARQHSLSAFALGGAMAGAAYSLLFTGGLRLINARAPHDHRAGTLSAIFLGAYLMQGAVAQALGLTATYWDLQAALDWGGLGLAVMGCLSTATMLLVLKGEPK